MRTSMMSFAGVVAVAAVLVVGGCGQKSDSVPPNTAGVAERTGTAVDNAAEKTVEVATNVAGKTTAAANKTAAATKDIAGQAVEKTGEALEKAGAAAEKTGAEIQE